MKKIEFKLPPLPRAPEKPQFRTESYFDILPCPCGKQPRIKIESRTYGHNDCGKEAYVQCDCGLRGKSFAIYGYSYDIHLYNTGESITVDSAVLWWNNVISKGVSAHES